MSITIKRILNKINEPRLTLEKFRYDLDPENAKISGFKRGAYFIWEYTNDDGHITQTCEYVMYLRQMPLEDWVRLGKDFVSDIKENEKLAALFEKNGYLIFPTKHNT